MKAVVAAVIASTLLAGPLAAQTRNPAPARAPLAGDDTPGVSLRPYGLVTGQFFTAKETFEAAFGRAFQPFWGGGLQVALRNGIFVDLAVSVFQKTGERTVRFNGQTFDLHVPLTATEMPFEATVGYRFKIQSRPAIRPYIGGGVGYYKYKETSNFSVAGDDVDTEHVGALGVGGVEFRVGRWIGLSGDVQYSYVPGILGRGGNSGCSLQNAAVCSGTPNENDLGGVAARFRVIIGR
jgi:hypothetical protein